MERSALTLLPIALVSAACASSSAPPPAAQTTVSASAPPVVAAAPQQRSGPFAWKGEPLVSGADRDQRLERECPWLATAIVDAKREGKLQGDAFITHLKRIAADHGKNGDTCLGYLLDGLRSYKEDIVRAEAKAALRVIARNIREADAPCLESTPAVPASLDAFAGASTYDSSPADWNAPAWQCLAWRLDQPQRYRYAVHVDAKKSNFVVVAERGSGEEVLFVRGEVRSSDVPVVMIRARTP